MDDLRARISFHRDIRDCNILCLTETWIMPSVPDTAVTPSDNFSVLRMDRTAEAGRTIPMLRAVREKIFSCNVYILYCVH